MKIKIIQHRNGYIENQLENKFFKPDFNLNRAYKLFKWYLKKYEKCKLEFDGYDFKVSAASSVYWDYIFRYIQYKTLLKENGLDQCQIGGEGRLKKIIGYVYYYKYNLPHVVRNVANNIIIIRNKFVIRIIKPEVVVIKFHMNEFRMTKLFDELNNKKKIEMYSFSKFIDYVYNFLNFEVLYHPLQVNNNNFHHKKEFTNRFLVGLENATYDIANKNLSRYQNYIKTFQNFKSIKFIISLDDLNLGYPISYACKELKITSICVQHGMYGQLHAGYSLPEKTIEDWFDYHVVWGDYWYKILNNFETFPSTTKFLKGSFVQSKCRSTSTRKKFKRLLFPFEFLTDQVEIGIFIQKFIEHGYEIYFKSRSSIPSEIIEELSLYQIKQYCPYILSETSDIAELIDVFVGTQSTIMFEFMQYQKPIWILDTKFTLLSSIQGVFSRVIKLSEIVRKENIDYLYSIDTQKTYDFDYFFSNNPVSKQINHIIR